LIVRGVKYADCFAYDAVLAVALITMPAWRFWEGYIVLVNVLHGIPVEGINLKKRELFLEV
jgi:hypothetical protein